MRLAMLMRETASTNDRSGHYHLVIVLSEKGFQNGQRGNSKLPKPCCSHCLQGIGPMRVCTSDLV